MQTSRDRLRIVETGKRIGAASGLELVQAQLDFNADSAQLLALMQQATMAHNALNTLLARDPGTAFTCTLTVEGQPQQVTVTFTDDAGTYEVSRPTAG